MSDQDTTDDVSGMRLNRRSVLKGIAASSVAATGIAVNVSASTQTDSTTIQNAKTSSKVRSIQDELGIASLPEPESGQITIEGEDSKEDAVFKYVFFFMEPGTLFYTKVHDGHTAALFQFGTGREDYSESFGFGSKADTSKQPASVSVATQYRGLPDGTDNTLIATDDGEVMYRRNATDDEIAMLRHVDGVSLRDKSVVTGSDIDGFHITTIEGEGEDAKKSSTRLTVDNATSVDPTRSLATQFDADDFSNDPLVHTTAPYEHPCFAVCSGCAVNLVGCVKCAPACATPATLWLCAVCYFATCHAILFTICGSCGQCLTDHPV